jgi:hypothetical protein
MKTMRQWLHSLRLPSILPRRLLRRLLRVRLSIRHQDFRQRVRAQGV